MVEQKFRHTRGISTEWSENVWCSENMCTEIIAIMFHAVDIPLIKLNIEPETPNYLSIAIYKQVFTKLIPWLSYRLRDA